MRGRTRSGRRRSSGAASATISDRASVAQALRLTWPQGAGGGIWAVSPGTSLSNTNLQGGLRLAFFAFIHAMMRSTLGISELQSRKTSGVQAARSLSVPRACPWVGCKTKQIATRAAINLNLVSFMNERPCEAIMTFSPLWLHRRDPPDGAIRLRSATYWSECRAWAALRLVFVVFRDICIPLPP
jgi:hypothetical protein